MIKAGIVGATGYTGVELVRLLYAHPEVELSALTSVSHIGEDISDIYPNLKECVSLKCSEQDLQSVFSVSDVVFAALPHGHSVPIVSEAIKNGKKIIDLGADFRLKNPGIYEQWYGLEHKAPELLPKAVYGLPELYKEQIRNAEIVANPGCFPTSIILAAAPLLRENLIMNQGIIADSKTGVSGAGKSPSDKTHFVECNENVNAYGILSHRHKPEIEQEFSSISGSEIRISFTPHLLPITRGIFSTVYAGFNTRISKEKLRDLYTSFYSEAPFVHVLAEGKWPHTRWVYGSNYCHINFAVDEEAGIVTVFSAIDNLVKGASGLAVQNMNIMFDLPEELGIKFPGVCP